MVAFNRKKWADDRLRLLAVVFFVLTIGVAGRLFYLQIIKHNYYLTLAHNQHKIDMELTRRRGEVFIHDSKNNSLEPLVLNRKMKEVYSVPKEILNPINTAEALAPLCAESLGKEAVMKEFIFNKVKKENDPYELLCRGLETEKAEQIKNLNLAGIYFVDEWQRYYPAKEKAGQVSGFLGFGDFERQGQYGIEGYFDEVLAGSKSKILATRDASGQLIENSGQSDNSEYGLDVVLTLDKMVMEKAYDLIKNAVEDYSALDGTIVVVDPFSGNILGMASYPNFDPNEYSKTKSIDLFRDLTAGVAYEPGSIFKAITMAIGIDSGVVAPDTIHNDEGDITIGGHTIRNAGKKVYGKINMTQVLENSVNTGAVNVALAIGRENFLDYLKKFGFGRKTGIALSGEVMGNISSLEKKGDIYLATASFGQGITVTPMQMVSAFSAIANGGIYRSPKIAEALRNRDGELIKPEINPEDNKRIIAEKTSNILKAMLVSVIKNGHTKSAGVDHYYVGGKTGTAEIAEEGIKGYSEKNNHSFIGFFPLEKTRFVVMVKITKPQKGVYAESTAAPTFAKMATFLLQYYQVSPEY